MPDGSICGKKTVFRGIAYLSMLLILPLCSCVPLPDDYKSSDAGFAYNAPAEGLDPGFLSQETAHFKISAYSRIDEISDYCEELYAAIMRETGLYSFVPSEPYKITVYRDSSEYHSKTRLPSWSGGAAYGNALLLYEGTSLGATAAHEMTHLIFNEYMGMNRNNSEYIWINEGLAVYMETKFSRISEAAYSRRFNNRIANNPIPFSQMVNLAPANESSKDTDRWYAQVWSVVRFMLERGGSFNFSVFISRLKSGDTIDQALEYAYKDWPSSKALEEAWLLHISR